MVVVRYSRTFFVIEKVTVYYLRYRDLGIEPGDQNLISLSRRLKRIFSRTIQQSGFKVSQHLPARAGCIAMEELARMSVCGPWHAHCNAVGAQTQITDEKSLNMVTP